MLLVFIAFQYSVNCQLHVTGYAYQLISGSYEGSSLSPELVLAYHNCWNDAGCKYIGKLKSTGQYVVLKSRKDLGNKWYYGIWRKRVEGMRYLTLYLLSVIGK